MNKEFELLYKYYKSHMPTNVNETVIQFANQNKLYTALENIDLLNAYFSDTTNDFAADSQVVMLDLMNRRTNPLMYLISLFNTRRLDPDQVINMAKLLIAQRPSLLNYETVDHNTPLIYALKSLKQNNIDFINDMINLFINSGANVNYPTGNGTTAISVLIDLIITNNAIIDGNLILLMTLPGILEMLLLHGATVTDAILNTIINTDPINEKNVLYQVKILVFMCYKEKLNIVKQIINNQGIDNLVNYKCFIIALIVYYNTFLMLEANNPYPGAMYIITALQELMLQHDYDSALSIIVNGIYNGEIPIENNNITNTTNNNNNTSTQSSLNIPEKPRSKLAEITVSKRGPPTELGSILIPKSNKIAKISAISPTNVPTLLNFQTKANAYNNSRILKIKSKLIEVPFKKELVYNSRIQAFINNIIAADCNIIKLQCRIINSMINYQLIEPHNVCEYNIDMSVETVCKKDPNMDFHETVQINLELMNKYLYPHLFDGAVNLSSLPDKETYRSALDAFIKLYSLQTVDPENYMNNNFINNL